MNMKKTIAAVAAASVAVSAMATTASALQDQTLSYNLVRETDIILSQSQVTISDVFSDVKLLAGGYLYIKPLSRTSAHALTGHNDLLDIAIYNDICRITGTYFDDDGKAGGSIAPITIHKRSWEEGYSVQGAELMHTPTDAAHDWSQTWEWETTGTTGGTLTTTQDGYYIKVPVVASGSGSNVSLVESGKANITIEYTYNSLDASVYKNVGDCNAALSGTAATKLLGYRVLSVNGDTATTTGGTLSAAEAAGGYTVTVPAVTDADSALAGKTATYKYDVATDTLAGTATIDTAGESAATIGGQTTGSGGAAAITELKKTKISAAGMKALLDAGTQAGKITVVNTAVETSVEIKLECAANGDEWKLAGGSDPVPTGITLLPAVDNDKGNSGGSTKVEVTLKFTATPEWVETTATKTNKAISGGTGMKYGDTTSVEFTVSGGTAIAANEIVYDSANPANKSSVNTGTTRGFSGGAQYIRAPYRTTIVTNGVGNDLWDTTNRFTYNNIIWYLEHNFVNAGASRKNSPTGAYGVYTNVEAVLNDAAQNYDVTFVFHTATQPVATVTVDGEVIGYYDPAGINYSVFGQHLYPLYDGADYYTNKGENTPYTGFDWLGLNLFNSALIVNGDFTMSLSDTDKFDWGESTVSFSWDSIVDSAAENNITNPYALWIHSLSLITSTTWYWDSMDVVLAVKEADDASADAGVESDDDEIDDDEAEEFDDTDDTDDFGGDDEEEDDFGGDDEEEEDNTQSEVTENPKTGNASVALAVIPVALAAAAVVAKKRS